jgi:hypothetical protein
MKNKFILDSISQIFCLVNIKDSEKFSFPSILLTLSPLWFRKAWSGDQELIFLKAFWVMQCCELRNELWESTSLGDWFVALDWASQSDPQPNKHWTGSCIRADQVLLIKFASQNASSLITRRNTSQRSTCPRCPCRHLYIQVFNHTAAGCQSVKSDQRDAQNHFHSGCSELSWLIFILIVLGEIFLTLTRAGETLPNSCPQTPFLDSIKANTLFKKVYSPFKKNNTFYWIFIS